MNHLTPSFKPMLAAAMKDPSIINYPLLASAKFDGIRAIVIGGQVYSRSLKLIPNKHIQALFGRSEFNGFDGELIVGLPTDPDCYNKTSSGVMSIDGEPDVHFYVFDDCSIPLDSFEHRLAVVGKRISKTPPSLRKFISRVPHAVVTNPKDLFLWEENFVTQGYEGIMVRHPAGEYKFGRSTEKQGWLLKIKRFEDSEAVIIGYKERMHNENEQEESELGYSKRSTKKAGMKPTGTLGAWIVTDVKTNIEFDVGTGFTEEQRIEYWKIRDGLADGGCVIKYKFQPAGVKEKPRFPVFMGFRHALDM